MTALVRPLRAADLPAVLAIGREAFPDDPGTLDSLRGLLARSPLTTSPRSAARLERLSQLIRLNQILFLLRFLRFSPRRGPAAQRYLVAEADGEVVGYACLDLAAGTSSVSAIAVRPDRERSGYGRALLAEVIAIAAASGCDNLSLHVRADNERAFDLYLRTGFTQTGLRRGYYQPSGRDAVVMNLALSSHLNSAQAAPDDARRAGVRRAGEVVEAPLVSTGSGSPAFRRAMNGVPETGGPRRADGRSSLPQPARWVVRTAVAAGAVGVALDLAGVHSPVRTVLVLLFLAVAPTVAIARLMPTLDGFSRLLIAATADVVLLALTAVVMLDEGVWSPTGGLLAVVAISAACSLAQLVPLRRVVASASQATGRTSTTGGSPADSPKIDHSSDPPE